MYIFKLERRISDIFLYDVDNSDIPRLLFLCVLSPSLWTVTIIDSFHWSGNSSLFQIALMSNILPPAWISSAAIWSLPGDFCSFFSAIANSTGDSLHLVLRPLFNLLYLLRMLDDDEWEQSVEWMEGKSKYSQETCPVSFCSPQIPYNLTWTRTRSVAGLSVSKFLLPWRYCLIYTSYILSGLKSFKS
jgi:hypothetical protein